MERSDALATIKEVAVEVLSVDPDQVTEEARFKKISRPTVSTSWSW